MTRPAWSSTSPAASASPSSSRPTTWPTPSASADLALRAAKAAGKGCVRTAGAPSTARWAAGPGWPATCRPRSTRSSSAWCTSRSRAGRAPDPRARGAGPLGPPGAGHRAARRVHRPRRGRRPDRPAAALGARTGHDRPRRRLLADGRDLKMGVNVSVRHLQAGCLAPDVARALAAAGVPPQRLMLEVTESLLIDARDRLEGDLADAARHGLRDRPRRLRPRLLVAGLPGPAAGRRARRWTASSSPASRATERGAALVRQRGRAGPPPGHRRRRRGCRDARPAGARCGRWAAAYLQGLLIGRPPSRWRSCAG